MVILCHKKSSGNFQQLEVVEQTCGRHNSSYYGDTYTHLKVRSREHIKISPMTFRKVNPSNESAISDHLLHCSNIPSFEEMTIFACGHHKDILETNETFLIKRDRLI